MSDLAEVLPAGSRRPSARVGYTAILLATLLFGSNATVSKSLLLSGIDAARLAELRTTGAFVIFAMIVAAVRPSAFRVTKAEWPAILAFGLIGVTFTQFLYFIGISLLPVSIALLLEFTAPIMVALYWRFWLRKQIGRGVWLGLILALTGLAVVAQVWQGFHLNIIGVICGFGAAAALAVYYLAGNRAVQPPFNRDAVSLTMWGFAMSALFWAIVQPWWTFPWSELFHPLVQGGLTSHGVPMWALVLWMIVAGTALSFWLEVTALRNISAAQVSTMGMLEPVFASVIAWVLLGESLTVVQILGGIIVLCGVYLAERSR